MHVFWSILLTRQMYTHIAYPCKSFADSIIWLLGVRDVLLHPDAHVPVRDALRSKMNDCTIGPTIQWNNKSSQIYNKIAFSLYSSLSGISSWVDITTHLEIPYRGIEWKGNFINYFIVPLALWLCQGRLIAKLHMELKETVNINQYWPFPTRNYVYRS